MIPSGVHFFENGHLVAEGGNGPSADAGHWAPPLIGLTLLTPTGERPTEEVLASKKHVALLFAGSWCPWCRAFDELLKDLYLKLRAADPDDTEVVFLSSCADEAAFQATHKSQPWAAVPYNRSQGENGETAIGYVRKAKRDAGKPQGTLGVKFNMESVPQFIVLDGNTGDVVCDKPMQQAGTTAAEGYMWTETAPASWLAASSAPTPKL